MNVPFEAFEYSPCKSGADINTSVYNGRSTSWLLDKQFNKRVLEVAQVDGRAVKDRVKKNVSI